MVVNCLNEAHGESWSAYHGDCCDVVAQMPDDRLHFSIFSPPFSQIFTYSDSISDIGNAADDVEFRAHYSFMVKELHRATMPGRLTAVHCSDLPLTKWRDGMIGIKDFSGDIIRVHQDAGWVLHSRVTIWKSPVVEMTRTKALGLLYMQLKKDSGRSRTGIPDYLLVFRKGGDNPEPIEHRPEDFPVTQWQEWASPVWMTVSQTNVLNVAIAREAADEKHLAPLQLDVIERALVLWSNPGDKVLSPFMGIGSEGVMSLKGGRRFVGVELKEAYWRRACLNLTAQEGQRELMPPPVVSADVA